jgi:hypothetical protein
MDGVDAVPKKRGPKTDVLEALLKRVDGLERRLKDEKKAHSDHSPGNDSGPSANGDSTNGDVQAPRPIIDTTIPGTLDESAVYSPTPTRYVLAHWNCIMTKFSFKAVLLHPAFSPMSFSIPTSPEYMGRHITSSTKLRRDKNYN